MDAKQEQCSCRLQTWSDHSSFNLTDSLEEHYLSVSKETLSWPPRCTTAEKTPGRSPAASAFWDVGDKLVWAFLCVLCVLSGGFIALGSASPSHKKQSSLGFVHMLWKSQIITIRHFSSLCGQQGFPPKWWALTPVGMVVLVSPYHHVHGDCSYSRIWAATIQGDLKQC